MNIIHLKRALFNKFIKNLNLIKKTLLKHKLANSMSLKKTIRLRPKMYDSILMNKNPKNSKLTIKILNFIIKNKVLKKKLKI